MYLDRTLLKIEVQCQHFFYRLDMIVTEMFVISYDLSWFSSLKNSLVLLLVHIIVHIDNVIKMMTSSKLLTSSRNVFLLNFLDCLLYC